MGEHAFLSPSAAERWTGCNAAPYREAAHADTTSTAAERGTAAHELLELAMKRPRRQLKSLVGRRAANGIEWTLDMAKDIHQVRKTLKTEYPGVTWLIEKKVPIYRAFGLKDPLVWGTADLITSYKNRLVVADLKYGTHAVNPVENKQLILYAIGAAHATGWKHKAIDLVILQPRVGKLLKRWQISREELRVWKRQLAQDIDKVGSASASSYASPGNYCYFCKAGKTCSEKVAAIFSEYA